MEVDYKELIEEAHEHQKGKVCTKCNTYKPLSEFCKRIKSRDGYAYKCKVCDYKMYSERCPINLRFYQKKNQCKIHNKKFTIEPTDIPGVKIEYFRAKNGSRCWRATEYPKNCTECGTKLGWVLSAMKHDTPSFDRLDPDIEYEPGNVMIVCQSCNMAKLNCPPDEWDTIKKKKARYILFGKTNK